MDNIHEPSMDDVYHLYQHKVALLSSSQKEKLCAAYNEGMSPFVIGCAILRAKQQERINRQQGRNNKITFNYIYRIIEDWLNHGITTDESFMTYWNAIHEDKHRLDRGGSVHGESGKEKITRKDYSYKAPPQQNKDFFSFLD